MSDSNITAETAEIPAAAVLRACGSCMLCCKAFEVKPLNKAAGKWCTHAKPGAGCSIHDARPDVCRAFQCEWTVNPRFNPAWQPDKTKFFVYRSRVNQYNIVVDPALPNAWRDPRYYAQIKEISAGLTDSGGLVVVFIGARRIVVLPDRDEDLGLGVADREIFIDILETTQGTQYKVRVGEVVSE